jgi:hypothetical protein
MTDPRDPHDPALGAAWRANVRDEPPAALDRSVLAAAHRAVESAPRAADAARPRWRAWTPLAVAAALGVIAFGIVELLPRETPNGNAVVSDMPVAPLRKDAAEPSPPLPAPSPQAPAPASAPPPPPSTAAKPAQPAQPAQPVERDAATPPSAAAGASRTLATESGSNVADKLRERREAAKQLQQRRETAAEVEQRRDNAAAPPQPFAGAPARAKVATPMAGEDKSAAAAAAAPPAPASPAPMARAQSAPAEGAVTRTPDDFIREIERLRSQHRDADAALALSAFRAAYDDADTRLPESLREWARGVPRP